MDAGGEYDFVVDVREEGLARYASFLSHARRFRAALYSPAAMFSRFIIPSLFLKGALDARQTRHQCSFVHLHCISAVQ
jgi:hypothetical protein